MEQKAINIIKTLKDAGFEAVFAGGFVRDKLLNIPSHDIDIATSATPDQVEALFDKTYAVGKSFGVIIVSVEGEEFEVATFRKDSPESSDGRHPDSVTFSSMYEDAQRRDLTINGMFYDPIEDKLMDFVGGKKDLNAGIIRLIGDPIKRIQEDKLRILRVIRFAVRFNYTIASTTFKAVKSHAAEINEVSNERIFKEIVQILKARNPRRAIDLLFKTGLITHILPEVEAMKGTEQPEDYHPEGDVLEHTIMVLENTPEDASEELLLGALLHDVGKPPTFQRAPDRIRFNAHDVKGAVIASTILRRFKSSKECHDRVTALVGDHMKFMSVQNMRVAKLKRLFRKDYFNEHMDLHKADCLSSHGSLHNWTFLNEMEFPPEEIKPERLVTGHDLLELGFKAGPLFREILEKIEDLQLEGEVSTREEAFEIIQKDYK